MEEYRRLTLLCKEFVSAGVDDSLQLANFVDDSQKLIAESC